MSVLILLRFYSTSFLCARTNNSNRPSSLFLLHHHFCSSNSISHSISVIQRSLKKQTRKRTNKKKKENARFYQSCVVLVWQVVYLPLHLIQPFNSFVHLSIILHVSLRTVCSYCTPLLDAISLSLSSPAVHFYLSSFISFTFSTLLTALTLIVYSYCTVLSMCSSLYIPLHHSCKTPFRHHQFLLCRISLPSISVLLSQTNEGTCSFECIHPPFILFLYTYMISLPKKFFLPFLRIIPLPIYHSFYKTSTES